MRDLFDKRTQKEKLWQFFQERQYVKSSEVLAWGVRNYSNRADRDARLLAKEEKIKRMNQGKIVSLYGNINEQVWEVVV